MIIFCMYKQKFVVEEQGIVGTYFVEVSIVLKKMTIGEL